MELDECDIELDEREPPEDVLLEWEPPLLDCAAESTGQAIIAIAMRAASEVCANLVIAIFLLVVFQNLSVRRTIWENVKK